MYVQKGPMIQLYKIAVPLKDSDSLARRRTNLRMSETTDIKD
jgi:hypothetical protein